jgi:hypothetical protein
MALASGLSVLFLVFLVPHAAGARYSGGHAQARQYDTANNKPCRHDYDEDQPLHPDQILGPYRTVTRGFTWSGCRTRPT